MLCKHASFYYWQHLAKTTDGILFGGLERKRITKNTLFAYLGIVDNQKGIFEYGWSCYDNANDILGFLQYLFIPTSFYTWMGRYSNRLLIPLTSFYVLKEHIAKNFLNTDDPNMYIDAKIMEKFYNYLDKIWKDEESVKIDKIDKLCNCFNRIWNKGPQKMLFIKVFKNTKEIYQFIFETEFKEVIEEDIGMSKNNFKFMCEHVYDEPLINRNLIKILNNKIPVWF